MAKTPRSIENLNAHQRLGIKHNLICVGTLNIKVVFPSSIDELLDADLVYRIEDAVVNQLELKSRMFALNDSISFSPKSSKRGCLDVSVWVLAVLGAGYKLVKDYPNLVAGVSLIRDHIDHVKLKLYGEKEVEFECTDSSDDFCLESEVEKAIRELSEQKR